MNRAALGLIVIVTFMACSAGSMPEVSSARNFDVRGDWFPSASVEPLPLDTAILGNRTDEVRQLLAEGANPNLRWGRSGDHLPLQELLNAGTGISIVAVTVQMLLDHGGPALHPVRCRNGSDP